MRVRVIIHAIVDSEAYWVPADGVTGIKTDLEELISDAVEECLDGIKIKRIEVEVDDHV
jgi:hypothetical protein|tara:strand:- start:1998 stop:2174 length:177 start_codon:yes stop_codon:yes gene_type:complete